MQKLQKILLRLILQRANCFYVSINEILFNHNAFYDFRILNPDTIPDIFGSTDFSAIENYEYNFENYINTDYNAQYGLGSNSISDLSNSSSISSLGFNSDLLSQSIPGLTSDYETHSISDLESIQDGSHDFPVKLTTNDFTSNRFEVGCYNGNNGAAWIAFVLFNFLVMFIIPLWVRLL